MQTLPTDGVDYNEPTNRYLLGTGQTRQCVETLILNDNLFEFDEIFTGQLIRVTDEDNEPLTAQDGLVLDIVETEVTIEDNDGKCHCVR